MKRKFTKYPNNKVYATKAYTKGYVESEPILVSSSGNFQLFIRGGIGREDTPYTDFEIKRSKKAHDAVVDIDVDRGFGTFSADGMPTINLPSKYKDEYATVSYGFRGERMPNSWIRDTFISVLNEAVQFCDELNNFFATTSKQELSDMCEDVFLDMGIDYQSYIQQEADSYL